MWAGIISNGLLWFQRTNSKLNWIGKRKDFLTNRKQVNHKTLSNNSETAALSLVTNMVCCPWS